MFTLKEWQIQLMTEILAARHFAKELPWVNGGYPIGTIVVPAHVEDGWVNVPERRHDVRYSPNFGIVCHPLTENGSARLLVQCVWEGSYFEPHAPLDPAIIEHERDLVLKNESLWAQIEP